MKSMSALRRKANRFRSQASGRVAEPCCIRLRGAGAFAAGRDRALEARNEKRVHALELLRRPFANGFVAGLRLCRPAEFIHRSTAAPGTLRHGGVRNSGDWKIDPARRLEQRASISRARARLNPSPRTRAVAAMASDSPGGGVQNEPLAM